MQFASQARAAILRRLTQLESELRQARSELKNLRSRDPAMAEVVLRGAMLSRERAILERKLEALREDRAQVAHHSF